LIQGESVSVNNYKFNLIDSTTRAEQIAQRASEAYVKGSVKREPKFRNGREQLPVIQVQINHLLYRLENYRTRSAQLSQVAAKQVPQGFFDAVRKEDFSAQQAQHDILVELAQQGSGETIIPIYDEFERVKEQTEELLISADGVVVNGNRRLAAMREHWASNQSDYAKFEFVSCAVLPESATADEVLTLEIELQMQPDTKLPYDWTVMALAARDLLDRSYTPERIAKLMNRDKDEINRILNMIDGADMYLGEWLGMPMAYDQLEETEQAFKQVATRNLQQGDNPALREITRKFDFLLIQERKGIETRAYELINNIEANPEQFLNAMAAEWALELEDTKTAPKQQLKISFDIPDDMTGAKDYGVLVQQLERLSADDSQRGEAARLVEQVCMIVGEQGKGKELAALRFAKAAHAKLAAIDLRLAGTSTHAELRAVLLSSSKLCDKLVTDLDGVTTKRGL
jgi:hypothetical protein